MRIERTADVRYVRSVIGHPEIKPEVMDGDGEPPVPMHESIYYLVPSVERHADGAIEDVPVGVVAFIQVNAISWNPHIAILPEHRGCGTEALQAAMRWMFENTPCEKVVAYPPAFNARMIHVFEKCGFFLEGRSPRSFKWRGQYHDRILMGKEK